RRAHGAPASRGASSSAPWVTSSAKHCVSEPDGPRRAPPKRGSTRRSPVTGGSRTLLSPVYGAWPYRPVLQGGSPTTRPSNDTWLLSRQRLQRRERGFVVGVRGHFRHVLQVRDGAGLIDHERRPRQQRQRQPLDFHAVIVPER